MITMIEIQMQKTETIQEYLDRLGWSGPSKKVNEYVDQLNARQDVGFYVRRLAGWPKETGYVIKAQPIWKNTWIVNDGLLGKGPSLEFVRCYLDCIAGYYEQEQLPAEEWIKCDGPVRELTPEGHVALVNLWNPNRPPIIKPIPQAPAPSFVSSVFKRIFSSRL